MRTSIMTICPRRWGFDVSDCHVGTVLVFIPGRALDVQTPIINESLTIAKPGDPSPDDELCQPK